MAGILGMYIESLFRKSAEERAAKAAQAQEHIKTAHEMIKKGDLTPDQTTWLANVGAQYGDPLIEGYGRNTYKKAKEQEASSQGVNAFIQQLLGGIMGTGGVAGTSDTQQQAQPQMGDAGIKMQPLPLGEPTKGPNATPTMATSSTPGYHPMTDTLANAIKQVESSGGKVLNSQMGEDSYGAYQFRPKTWELESKAYTQEIQGAPVVLRQTPANEDAVAKWRINKLLNEGHGPEGVAKYWQTMDPNTKITTGVNAQGVAYDVPGYVQKVQAAMGGVVTPTNGTRLVPPTIGLPMGATFTVTDAGSGSPKLNLQFKMPTMDERESAAFSQLDVAQQLQFLTGKWAKAAGMEPIRQIGKDETTGQQMVTTFDPMRGVVNIIGSGVKTAYTPVEQQQINAYGAGLKVGAEAEAQTVPGGGSGKTPMQIDAERQAATTKAIEAEKRRLIPSEGVKELGATQKVLDRIDRIKGIFAKHTNKDVSLVGKMEFLREVGDSFDAFAEPDRIELRNLTAQLTESMYDTRGKQLSDKEIKTAEKLIPKMSSQTVGYLTNLRAFQDYIEGASRANKAAWERAGYTMDQVNAMPAEKANAILETLQGGGAGGGGVTDGMTRKADPGLQIGQVYPDGKGGSAEYLGGPKLDIKSWKVVEEGK